MIAVVMVVTVVLVAIFAYALCKAADDGRD